MNIKEYIFRKKNNLFKLNSMRSFVKDTVKFLDSNLPDKEKLVMLEVYIDTFKDMWKVIYKESQTKLKGVEEIDFHIN